MSTELLGSAALPLPSISTVRCVVLLVSFFGIVTFGSVPILPLTFTWALAFPAAVGVHPEAEELPLPEQPTRETRRPSAATALRTLGNDRDCDTKLLSGQREWRNGTGPEQVCTIRLCTSCTSLFPATENMTNVTGKP